MGRKIGYGISILCVVVALALLINNSYFSAGGKQADSGNITMVDSVGREVTMPAHPHRVVILNASNVDLYVAAGGADDIVGKPVTASLSDEVVKATAGAEVIGEIHNPSVEKILALKPDLVIGTNVPFHIGLADTLKQAGIPIYINAVDNFEKLYDTLDTFGKLSGNDSIAKKRIERLQKEYIEVIDSIKGKTPPKSVVIFGTPQSSNMATSETFTGDLIKRLGGGNVSDNLDNVDRGYVPLNMEFISKENPEVIFIIMMAPSEEAKAKVIKDLETKDAWSGTSAVKNGKVYILSHKLFTINPGVQAIDALKELKQYMYQ